jgi:hypothetical protein
MSFPRLPVVLLPMVFALPLVTGGCGGPVLVSAASYGADGVSLVESGKTTTDHLISAISKKDCALWRFFRNENVCHDRPDDHDPYNVNYNEPFREPSESGVSYAPPLRAASDAPTTSWDAASYKPAPSPPTPTPAPIPTPPEPPITATADAPPSPPPPQPATAAPAAPKHKKAKVARTAKRPSRDQAGSTP